MTAGTMAAATTMKSADVRVIIPDVGTRMDKLKVMREPLAPEVIILSIYFLKRTLKNAVVLNMMYHT